MTGFWHTYGALITVLLVLLGVAMVVVFCHRFLSAGSDADGGTAGGEGRRRSHEGHAHE